MTYVAFSAFVVAFWTSGFIYVVRTIFLIAAKFRDDLAINLTIFTTFWLIQ